MKLFNKLTSAKSYFKRKMKEREVRSLRKRQKKYTLGELTRLEEVQKAEIRKAKYSYLTPMKSSKRNTSAGAKGVLARSSQSQREWFGGDNIPMVEGKVPSLKDEQGGFPRL